MVVGAKKTKAQLILFCKVLDATIIAIDYYCDLDA
jgi:hypothetical protein